MRTPHGGTVTLQQAMIDPQHYRNGMYYFNVVITSTQRGLSVTAQDVNRIAQLAGELAGADGVFAIGVLKGAGTNSRTYFQCLFAFRYASPRRLDRVINKWLEKTTSSTSVTRAVCAASAAAARSCA